MYHTLLALCLAATLTLVCTERVIGEEPQEASYSWLNTRGTHIVNEAGEPVILRGCNVGNWFMLEMWMLTIDHGQFSDQYEFEANLTRRFGGSEKDRLMEVYRENWITPRDFKNIKSFGFNVIRLPFNYRLLQDDDKPFELREDAFKWLDRAVDMAEDAGLYVILDLHGVPGGQSIDHTTGRSDQNKLWDDPVNGERTAWLWKKIANRYKDRASVAGYDVINEPYGNFSMDVRPKLFGVFTQIHDAIRGVDQQHIIFAPAPIWGGHGFYGKPADHGWTNVAFTEHHYPGLFGSDPSLRTHGNFIHRTLPEKQAMLEEVQTPMYIGEWNPVFERLGGGDLMRRYFDEYGKFGWAATIWSYKILHNEGGVIKDNWYMVSNAEPIEKPDFETASIEDIEVYFKWFGTMEYVIDEPMREALTRDEAVALDLPAPPPMVTKPPHTDDWPGWTASDIGGSLAGGQQVHSADEVTVYGGGNDIWHESDQFRLIWKEARGDFVMTATLESLADTNDYAKAGLMVRDDLSPGSAHVLLNLFPSGQIALGWRAAAGELMKQTEADNHAWPIHLRLTRKGNTILAEFSTDGNIWQRAGDPVVLPSLGKNCHVGLAVLSHVPEALTEARFKNIELK
jgi:endoglucanase